MIRIKKQQIFSQADRKMQKSTGKEAEKFIESYEKGMKNIRPIGINSVIDGRSGLQKRIFPGKESRKKTKKLRSPDKKSRKA
jgi:hypothetical protein